jgi:hypothetical protein
MFIIRRCTFDGPIQFYLIAAVSVARSILRFVANLACCRSDFVLQTGEHDALMIRDLSAAERFSST